MKTKYTEAPKDKDLVRLFNNGQGAIKHTITLADGKPVDYTIAGNAFAKVPKEVAEFWLGHFPRRIVSDTEAHETANAARAELSTAQARIAELEAQLAEAKGEKPVKKKSSGADAV